MTSYTAALNDDQVKRLRELLTEMEFDFEAKPYTIFAARKNKLAIAVYQKGPKVLVQGKGTEDFVRFSLEPEVLGEARLGYEEILEPEHFAPHFGIDESGKGDFFGPLVIAGVYTDSAITRSLIDAGVMDSKRISSAAKIRKLASLIRATPKIASAVVAIHPERYNEMYQSFGNLNRLLAWGHAAVIEQLVAQRPSCPRALSDQFARPEVLEKALAQKGLKITLEQRTKGESDTAVAAASILARERFIDWIDKSSANCGVTLPLGASSSVVAAGRLLVEQAGSEALNRFAKLHFRTSAQIASEGAPE